MSTLKAPPPVSFSRSCALREVLFPHSTCAKSEQKLLDVLFARFAQDRRRFSDILEWSLSGDEHHVQAARFSYAFPAYIHEREAATRTVLECFSEFGPTPLRAAKSVLRAAISPHVEQILIGYARSSEPDSWRAKLYLQFRDGAGPAALQLARAVVGTRRATQSDDLPLHLLGLDIGSEGLSGAKFYFVQQKEIPANLDWIGQPRAALRIHRLTHPEDPAFETPSEIDFAVDGALWQTLTSAPVRAHYEKTCAHFEELGRSFKLRVRRVSVALGNGRKINVYYALDEVE